MNFDKFGFTLMQLLLHPFITKYEAAKVDLEGFVRSVFDPTQRMKDLADVSSCHFLSIYYLSRHAYLFLVVISFICFT